MNNAATFYISYQATILHHQWENECVIYHTVSGETHLLEKTAAEVLLAIAGTPLTYQQLVDRLKSTYDDAEDNELEEYLSETLSQFQNMDLITLSKE